MRRNMSEPAVKWRKKRTKLEMDSGSSASSSASSTPSMQKKRSVPKGSNWAPLVTGNHEDFENMASELKDYINSGQNDIDHIDYIMQKTFPLRRSLVNTGPPIQTILEEYPALKIVEVCPKEMTRLTCVDAMKIFKTNLTKIPENVMNIIKNKKKKTERSDAIINRLDCVIADLDEITPKSVFVHKLIASCLMLPHLFDEDDGSFIKEISTDENLMELVKCGPRTPFIIAIKPFDSKNRIFYIAVEGNIILNNKDILEAVFLLMSTYWIFYIEYPIKARHTYQFLQHFALQLSFGETPAKKVITIAQKVSI
ncbi:sterile alpha motif domain-containing protein 3-like [Ylistrum balloti]|uniref:sterile alpha motif domain-containing protein 3-like n=1 Tax=Ylistrum balloti TaxID=509963 RepID=UPI002905F76A|nr:sterile alpha motif domain-containing protein 3-like [Ylistrum balloti]